MQQKVRTYLSNKRRQSDGNGNVQPKPEMKTIKVPIPTYPPTAMVYSVNKCLGELSQYTYKIFCGRESRDCGAH